MATSEERIDRLEEKTHDLTTSISILVRELHDFKDEMKDFKQEMREQNKMRATENAEIRNDIKEIYKTTDAKIDAIRTTVYGMGKHVRNLTYTAIGAIAAMVITVLLNLPK